MSLELGVALDQKRFSYIGTVRRARVSPKKTSAGTETKRAEDARVMVKTEINFRRV